MNHVNRLSCEIPASCYRPGQSRRNYEFAMDKIERIKAWLDDRSTAISLVQTSRGNVPLEILLSVGRDVGLPLMIPLGMVMHNILAQRPPQGALAEENHLGQALLLDRPDIAPRRHSGSGCVPAARAVQLDLMQ